MTTSIIFWVSGNKQQWYLGGSLAQANCISSKIDSRLELLYIHQMNRVNSCHDASTSNAPIMLWPIIGAK